MNAITRVFALPLVVLGICMGAPEARAAADWKSITPSICQPYGPNTSASELSYTQKGITNPGTTNESVLCSLGSDGDSAWSNVNGGSGNIYVFYQVGGIPGRAA